MFKKIKMNNVLALKIAKWTFVVLNLAQAMSFLSIGENMGAIIQAVISLAIFLSFTSYISILEKFDQF